MRELSAHPLASFFPPMERDDFAQLKKDIKDNGLREAIWLHEGQIVDGLNRYKACLELGIEPATRQWDGKGSLVAFALSLNLYRRHLTISQHTALGVRVLPALEREARERQAHGQTAPGKTLSAEMRQASGKASEEAARLLGVSPRNIQEGKRIQREDPDAFREIEAGRKTIGAVVRARQELRGMRQLKGRDLERDAQKIVQGIPMIPCPHCGGKGYIPEQAA